MSEEEQIQEITLGLIKKLKDFEKKNKDLDAIVKRQQKSIEEQEEELKTQTEEAQLWKGTAETHEQAVERYKTREIKGVEIFNEYFGSLYMDQLNLILRPFIEGNKKVYEMIIDLPKGDQQSLEAFRKKQDTAMLKQIKKLQDTK